MLRSSFMMLVATSGQAPFSSPPGVVNIDQLRWMMGDNISASEGISVNLPLD